MLMVESEMNETLMNPRFRYGRQLKRFCSSEGKKNNVSYWKETDKVNTILRP